MHMCFQTYRSALVLSPGVAKVAIDTTIIEKFSVEVTDKLFDFIREYNFVCRRKDICFKLFYIKKSWQINNNCTEISCYIIVLFDTASMNDPKCNDLTKAMKLDNLISTDITIFLDTNWPYSRFFPVLG